MTPIAGHLLTIMRRRRGYMVRTVELFSWSEQDEELAAELAGHIELHMENNRRLGMSAETARRHALMRLGGIEQVMEACREQRSVFSSSASSRPRRTVPRGSDSRDCLR
jgi:hypothetical protein